MSDACCGHCFCLAVQICTAVTAHTCAQLLRAGELSKRIVAFLASKGGSAPSAEVVSSFQEVVPQAELPLFRHVLQQVARLQRSATGGGKQWVLAPEFVPDS